MSHPSTTQTRELIVPGRVERLAKRSRRRRLAGAFLALAVFFALAVAGVSQAQAGEHRDHDKAKHHHHKDHHKKEHGKDRNHKDRDKGRHHDSHKHKHDRDKPKGCHGDKCGPYKCKGKCEPCKNGPGTCKKRPPCKPKPPVDKPKPPKPDHPKPPVDHPDKPKPPQKPKPPVDTPDTPALIPPVTYKRVPPAKQAPPKKEAPKTPAAPKAPTANLLPFTGPEDGDLQAHPDRMVHLALFSLGLLILGALFLVASNRRKVAFARQARTIARATAKAMTGSARDGRDALISEAAVARGREVMARLLGKS